MANYGSIEGIPMGDAKLRVITMKNTGSWLAPKNDLQKQDFLRKANELSVSQEHIKGSPLFSTAEMTLAKSMQKMPLLEVTIIPRQLKQNRERQSTLLEV